MRPDNYCDNFNFSMNKSVSPYVVVLRLQHTEEKEDNMEVEEGEMGEDDAPAPW